MTPSSTQTNEGHDRSSPRNEDTDWVVVKAGADTTKEDFELIDSAEARCWCGSSDAELCRRKGHRWPLCTVEQGEDLSPKQLHEIGSYQSSDKEENYERGNIKSGGNHDDKQSSANNFNEANEKPAPPQTTAPPTPHDTGPFTKLAVLTDLLDPAKQDDEGLYSAYHKIASRRGQRQRSGSGLGPF